MATTCRLSSSQVSSSTYVLKSSSLALPRCRLDALHVAKQAHAALGAADASLQELVDGAEPPSAMALPEVSPVWAPGSRPPWRR